MDLVANQTVGNALPKVGDRDANREWGDTRKRALREGGFGSAEAARLHVTHMHVCARCG